MQCLQVQRAVDPSVEMSSSEVSSHFQAVVTATATNRNSMLQDLEAARRTEIDFLNGWVRREGEERGIDVARCRELEETVKRLEAEVVLDR